MSGKSPDGRASEDTRSSTARPEPEAYRGLPLAETVPGMKQIQPVPVRLRRNNE